MELKFTTYFLAPVGLHLYTELDRFWTSPSY